MKVRPANSLNGTVRLPGDKSISHRTAMLASIANGETHIVNYAASEDCASTLGCLAELGVKIERNSDSVIVHGVGKGGLRQSENALDCGNSGTTIRLLSGILAGQSFETTLIGDSSLQKRPMKRIIDPLTKMGAAIDSYESRAPITISGKSPLSAIEYQPPVASAQIKSCVLLAGLYGDGETTVLEPVATRDHTERMLEWFGVEVKINGDGPARRISVSGNARLKARDISVPADISAAAFFMVAAACLDGSEIEMPNVGMNPSRIGIYNVLRELGAQIEAVEAIEACNEPVARIHVKGGIDGGYGETPVIRGSVIANLIDEIPILAVFGTQLENGIEIRDAAELRVKESDRIAAVVENLRRMGGDVTEFDDGLHVGRSSLKGAVIESYGDHRIAMAFAIAGLFAEGETGINGAECAAVSFPGFFEILESVVR